MADRIGRARGRLAAVTGEVRRALADMTEGSSRLAARRTEVVSGVLGGSGTMALAYVATASSASLSFLFLGPLLGIAGIAGGILVGRYLKLNLKEDAAEFRRRLLDENSEGERLLKERLATLPAGTPKAIKDDLYRQYMEINHQLTDILRPEPRVPQLPAPLPANLRIEGRTPTAQPPSSDTSDQTQ